MVGVVWSYCQANETGWKREVKREVFWARLWLDIKFEPSSGEGLWSRFVVRTCGQPGHFVAGGHVPTGQQLCCWKGEVKRGEKEVGRELQGMGGYVCAVS